MQPPGSRNRIPARAGATSPPSPATTLHAHSRWDADPAADLILEEALLRDVAAGGPPTVFAFGWTRGAVVLGRGQPAAEIDLDAARAHGLAVVRRTSGGKAVVHRGDLSLSLVLPESHPWTTSIPRLYDRFLDGILETLRAFGIPGLTRPAPVTPRTRSPICFEGNAGETLALDGRKVVGCAQARRRGAVLVHGMFVLEPAPDLAAAVFATTPERIRTVVGALPPVAGPRERLADAIGRSLGRALELRIVAAATPRPPSDLADRLFDPRWVPVAPSETKAPSRIEDG